MGARGHELQSREGDLPWMRDRVGALFLSLEKLQQIKLPKDCSPAIREYAKTEMEYLQMVASRMASLPENQKALLNEFRRTATNLHTVADTFGLNRHMTMPNYDKEDNWAQLFGNISWWYDVLSQYNSVVPINLASLNALLLDIWHGMDAKKPDYPEKVWLFIRKFESAMRVVEAAQNMERR